MDREELLNRIVRDPEICAGQPCVRGTRINVTIILDALAEGLTTQQILEHYPHLKQEDIQAAAAYGAELARENIWKIAG